MKETRLKARINKSVLKDNRARHGERIVISDTEIRGFRVVMGERSASYILEKRIKGVTRSATKLTIGSFPTMTVDEARRTAMAWSLACDKGIDPRINQPTAKKERSADQFGIRTAEDITVRVAYEIHKKYARLKPRTCQGYDSVLRCHLNDILEATFDKLSENYIRAKGDGIAENTSICMARMSLSMLSAIWSSAKRYADSRQIPFPGNVIALIKPKKTYRTETKKKVVPVKDLGRFICFLEDLRDRIDVSPSVALFADIYLVMLFLGIRISEALKLRWEYLHMEQGYYIIPGHELKNGFTHYKPLSDYPLSIIKAQKLRARLNNPFVFPSTHRRRVGHISPNSIINKLILQETGIEIESHAMRRTYLSLADHLGIPKQARKELVNHVSDDVTDDYSVAAFNPMRGSTHQDEIENAFLEIRRRYLENEPLPKVLSTLLANKEEGPSVTNLMNENQRLLKEVERLQALVSN